MTKLLVLAGLAVGGVLAAAIALRPMPANSAVVAPSLGNVDELLRRYDLSPVLRTPPDDPTDYVEVMNGFFGADRYRIDFVMTRVQRDPQQPNRYQVWGKDRFKGRVTPFSGTLIFTSARQTVARKYPDLPNGYVAIGTYELREAPDAKGTGTFRGQLAADFGVEKSEVVHEYHNYNGPTKGGGVLYDGTWTSAAGETKPAVWVADIWSYHGPQVFQNFIVGERSQHFNAKYAKLGWNNYWSNDEWWTTEPSVVAKRK